MPTFHVLCPAWAERADRRPNPRPRLRSAPIPAAMQTWRRPDSVLKSSYRHRFAPSRFLPSRIFRWLHHIHPIHRHHTAPHTSKTRPICLVQLKIARDAPACWGSHSRSGRPRAVRPDSHCNFGDRRIRGVSCGCSTQRKSLKRGVPSKRFGTHARHASALFAAPHRARQRGGTGTPY
jgi:hypothetical protein